MIESEKFKRIEEDFRKFSIEVEKENIFKQEICYLFKQALENMKSGHFEISNLIFSVIIESISFKKIPEPHKNFDSWLIEKRKERLEKFVEELKQESDSRKIVEDWHRVYNETYGPRKNFIKIILETYEKSNKIPSFLFNVEKNSNEISKSMPVMERTLNELNKDLQNVSGIIYDEYRSKFIHEAKFLGFEESINTKIGGISSTKRISSQDIAKIALDVVKLNL